MNKIHHIGIATNDLTRLKEEIPKIKREGCILIQNISYAELLKSNICFLYTKDRKVIELVEDNG